MNRSSCHTCGRKIDGPLISLPAVGERVYHPECFLCQGCGRRIEGAFKIHQDQPYHTICLGLLLDLRCQGCGGLITDEYIEALEHKWHPEHFRCTNCRALLPQAMYFQRNGKPYCRDCHATLFLPRCDICGHPVAEKSVRNLWGDLYCGSHVFEFRECACCHRPICPGITGGGSLAPDGRALCSLCRKTAVNHLRQAWPAFNRVRRHFSRLGMDLVHIPLTLDLVDQGTLLSPVSLGRPPVPLKVTPGRAMVPVTARTPVGREDRIQILTGLPWELFTAVCACELGHAWLHLKNDSMLIAEAEQDFCKSLGARWLASLGTSSSEVWARLLEESRGDLYSRGPRAG